MSVNGFIGELHSLKQLYFISLKGRQLLGSHIKSLPANAREAQYSSKQVSSENECSSLSGRESVYTIRIRVVSSRETIFVRVISALEVLFIDSATNIFLSDRSALRAGSDLLPFIPKVRKLDA